jgi:hypothetical protein
MFNLAFVVFALAPLTPLMVAGICLLTGSLTLDGWR